MGGNPVAERIGRLLRDGTDPGSIAIDVRHRGAAGDRQTLTGEAVVAAGARGLELADGRRLPWHRVIEVRLEGAVVYPRRDAGGTQVS